MTGDCDRDPRAHGHSGAPICHLPGSGRSHPGTSRTGAPSCRILRTPKGLKRVIAALRSERDPFYLRWEEAARIVHRKLDDQYARNRSRWERNLNAGDAVGTATKAAFAINSNDGDLEIVLRLGILTSLSGVAIPIASAFLALVGPEKYAVIDFRGWRQVFGGHPDDRKTDFTVPQYRRYLTRVRQLAPQLGWQPEEVDLAIWAYDIAEEKERRRAESRGAAQTRS